MAGQGPAPKDPGRRVRKNADPHPQTILRHEVAGQPDLPTFQVENDGELTEFVWPARTQQWWAMWGDAPQSDDFSSTDWDFMLDTAMLHAAYWSGRLSAGPELRLRVAKFGATPEDRARLRMQFAQADEADAKRPKDGSTAEAHYAGLSVVEDSGTEVA